MTTNTKGNEEQRPAGKDRITPKDPTSAGLLLEQYKLLEARRKFFGSQFMQTAGGVAAIFSLFVGLLGGRPENEVLLRPALLIGGIAFILLAFLGHRLGKRQDDCEQVMSEIESALRSMDYAMVATMPTGAKGFGARRAIVLFLAGMGISLIVVGFIKGTLWRF